MEMKVDIIPARNEKEQENLYNTNEEDCYEKEERGSSEKTFSSQNENQQKVSNHFIDSNH